MQSAMLHGKYDTMKYEVTNTHSVTRSYPAPNGGEIVFKPGETKKLKTKPPKRQGNWVIEAVEQTAKPSDIKSKENGGE